jgi:tripartite-type tricarboxylate transporter receptor subunit TctC
MITLGLVRILALGGALALSAGVWAQSRAAQDYPNKPVKMIVGFPPGGSNDQVARIIAPEMAKALGQPVVIENKPGANGVLAAAAVARAAPDGYTIFMTTNSSMSAAPYLLKSISYDPAKDFAQISRMGNLPFVMVISQSIPANDFASFVAYAKANPGKLNYASSNATGIVGGAMVSRLAGIQMNHVPYKSAPQAVQDLLRGEISMMFVDFPSGLPHVRSGAVRALVVTTAARSALVPDVPSMSEAGLDFDMASWNAIVAPAGTPAPVVTRLNKELREIVADPVNYARLRAVGFDAFTSTPEELGAFLRGELVKWSRWTKEAGIVPE